MNLVSTVAVIVTALTTVTLAQRGVTRACSLQIVTDPLFWRHVKDQVVEEENLEDEEEMERVARFRLTSLTSRLVNMANSVLNRYYFSNTKYRLVLHNVKILQEGDCLYEGIDLCGEDMSLASLLDSYSYINHDRYCLSYLLTFRNFPAGSLGLAWTASGDSGGVCDKHRLHTEVPLPSYEVTVNKSLNTGVVSLSRNFLPVSERVAALTFSHEISHSFGSPHDSGAVCEGGGSQGHYLMYPSGSLGLLPNNMQLSPCSTGNMTEVLSHRGGCWTVDSGHGVCGNSVVEGWEQCDCGDDVAVCQDSCCVPLNDPGGRQPCTLTKGAACSPSEGLCCNSTCQFSPSTVQCSKSSECSQPAFCHGARAICPAPEHKEDLTLCQGGSKTCQGGECSGSICQGLGMLPCQPYASSDTSAACQPHCKSAGSECTPVQEVAFPEATECAVGGGFGHCSGSGACYVAGGEAGPAWLVGLVLFLVGYLLACVVGTWVYCMYCRGGNITAGNHQGYKEDTEERGERDQEEKEEGAFSTSQSDRS